METNIPIKEMSPYAPIRLQNEFWWQFSANIAQKGFVAKDGKFSGDVPNMIMKQVIHPIIASAAEAAKAGNEINQAMPLLIANSFELRHWIPLTAQYQLSGKQIFDLGDTLVEMLLNTDVSDCTLKNWQSPYEAFFIRFGKQNKISLEFDEGVREYADGAFIAVTPWDDAGTQRRIKIGFTMVKDDNSGVMLPGYFMDIIPEEQDMPIKESIQHAINRRIANLESEVTNDALSASIKASRIDEIKKGEKIVKALLELVINSMFYIESLGGESKFSPGRDAPPLYVAEWENATPEKRVKLRKKIINDGYTIVRMAGHELNGSSGTNTGEFKKTHWRRGHWRNQPYGEKLSLVKMRWIKPVMVNADKSTEPVTGHIYVAENKASIH